MNSKKWPAICALLIILPLILGLICFPDRLSLTLSNIYFYLSAPFLIAGLFGLVIKDGTFDFFYYSLKKFKQFFQPEDLPKEEIPLHYLSSRIGKSWFKTALKIGGLLLLAAVFCLAAYYLI